MDRIFPKSLLKRWKNPKNLIQVFTGPRQVGKTTRALSLIDGKKAIYASADTPTPPTNDFIIENWQKARALKSKQPTLVLDEVQKIPRWSEVVKQLWDEDQKEKNNLRVCLLGSSALLIEKGLSESLTGRFEVNFFPYWTFVECFKAFKVSWQQYAYLGAYPKAYSFSDDTERLDAYLQNSVIEPTLGRDILALHSIEKPALLRQLFWYVSKLPSQIVSYEKILSHLQGRGNSATLVHYAKLLELAYVIKAIPKYNPKLYRTKRSIPKWIFPNPGLIDNSLKKEGIEGFVFENLVGSHLLNITFGNKNYELTYWRENNQEIDFVLTHKGEAVLAIEVKSGRKKGVLATKKLTEKLGKMPFLIVDTNNIEKYLKTLSVDEVIKMGK